MSYKPTVTVLGANGALGIHVLRALVSDTFKQSYSLPIRVVTRDLSKIQASLGVTDVELKPYSANIQTGEGLDSAFNGADVVINLLAIDFSHDKIVDTAAAAGSVKLYIPSEFGTYIPGSGPFKNIFGSKIPNLEYALSKGLHAVSLAKGAFFEWVLDLPVVGLNAPEKGKFTYYGSIDTKITSTSLVDVGKVVASLAAKEPSSVPSEVLVGGDTFTLRELKAAYEKAFNVTLENVARPLEEIVQKGEEVAKNGVKSLDDFVEGLDAVLATGRLTHKTEHNDFVAKGNFKFIGLEEAAAAAVARQQ